MPAEQDLPEYGPPAGWTVVKAVDVPRVPRGPLYPPRRYRVYRHDTDGDYSLVELSDDGRQVFHVMPSDGPKDNPGARMVGPWHRPEYVSAGHSRSGVMAALKHVLEEQQ